MRHSRVFVASLLFASPWLLAPGTAAAVPAEDDGRGDPDVTRAAYEWLGPDTPNDSYEIVLVRGRSVRSVLRILEPRRELGSWTPSRAYGWYLDRYEDDPQVSQVEAHGPGVVIVNISGYFTDGLLARLSRRGTVSSFGTTVELDTYITVARRGRVVRQFDTGFRPPRAGALPEERGLRFGQRGVDPFSPAWALNERLTLIHVSEEWFFGRHPTYVLPRPY